MQTTSIGSAVEHLVAEAKAAGAVVRTGEAAKRLAHDNPDCGISLKALAQEVARQAIAAGVPIQFTSPE